MSNYDARYYDHAWPSITGSLSAWEGRRVKAITEMLPADCHSILDVGCGDGRVTNELLRQGRSVVGLDISRGGLKYVRTEAICGSADVLPFTDNSFNLVLCTETLEHLPETIYHKALAELERVARQFILAGVPFEEKLTNSMVACPRCDTRFHNSWHQRSFTESTLRSLFQHFGTHHRQYEGAWTAYPEWLLAVLRYSGLLPQPQLPSFSAPMLCPQCGYHLPQAECKSASEATGRTTAIPQWCKAAGKALCGRTRYPWVLALYQRWRDPTPTPSTEGE